ncbi:GNAT family N-acetyltransferase [Streptomyces sp. 35G-GA-8]|uniref:GNAT family N-acetyltransferase n=1 Tax=Streptomyces sp. 35G-GA-8 TaxID=2939434 RepID=UPI00201F06E8|nr:GNAT family N-acetyltransferase [Streptomyces sp. 35G-GA-8]MCL7375767.1 GNAT family N-acetyltransferase [Streptomyces sp. 35G-GA-8]
MDHDVELAAFDRRMRRDARPDGPGVRVERVGEVVRLSGAAHDWHGVLWSELTEDTAAGAIAAQIAYFTSLGREFEWKLYAHDRPVGLADRLRAAGFTPGATEALMVRETGDTPGEPALPDGVRLLTVTDAAGAALLADVHERAFGTDGTALRERLSAQLASAPETVVAVVAMAGDTPVSAARMELPPGTDFAGLWGGGTVREWRGRGLYRALVAHRARIAAERGYRLLHVDAMDMSRPILERLGFRVLSTTTPFVYRPPVPGSVGSAGSEGSAGSTSPTGSTGSLG